MGGTESRREEGAAIRALLAEALSDEYPRSGVREFALERRPRFRVPRHWLAFGLSVVVLPLMLRLPLGLRMITSLPVLGDALGSCVKVFARDLAYQAGLAQEINVTQVAGGIRLTAVGAQSDGDGTTLFYTLSPEPGQESEAWSRIRDRTLQLTQCVLARGDTEFRANPSSYWFYSSQADCVYGMVRGASIGALDLLLGGGVTLSVEAREALPLGGASIGSTASALGRAVVGWTLQVPTQSVPFGEHRIGVEKVVPGTDDRLMVTDVIFSPLRVVLRYEVSPVADAADRLLGECFALVTGDGVEIPSFGYSTPVDSAAPTRGEVYFFPTHQRDLQVVFRQLTLVSVSQETQAQPDEFTLHEGRMIAVAGVKTGDGGSHLDLGSDAIMPFRLYTSPLYELDPAGVSVFELRR